MPFVTPSICAVIPAYNAEFIVGDAIQSALDQTHALDEIIVVDDGSSDNTSQVASRYARTTVIRQPNAGPGAARNAGIRAASSEWIALLDSDDIWLPHKTETQIRQITTDAGVIHANAFDPINFGTLWHRQAHITPSGALVRKKAWADVGGFEESRSVIGVEDANLWMKIALTSWQFVQSDTNVFGYRPTAQSLSGNDLKMARAELANIDIIGALVRCQPEEVERVKQASMIEYAKGLIANERWDEASELLQQCGTGLASRWLSLVRVVKINRLARTNLVRWLHATDARYGSHTCSGECNLPDLQRQQCIESCKRPFFRP